MVESDAVCVCVMEMSCPECGNVLDRIDRSYQCTGCGGTWRPALRDGSVECPDCHRDMVRRAVSHLGRIVPLQEWSCAPCGVLVRRAPR